MSTTVGGDAAAVTATDGHPFWTPEGAGWTEAEGLLPGTRLRASSGTWPQVTGVEVRDVPDRRVHNLTVEGLHTYYVLAGATPVLVHDADDLCGVTSAIHDDPYLVKAAEAAGRNQRLQKEMDDLVMQFRSGNKNPGLGNKALEGTDISYLRGRNGGRVFIPEHRRRDPDRRQGGQIEREQGHQPSQGALRKLTMYEISENGLTLRVELGGDEPDEVENADGWVLVPGGGEWSATFLTHREMGRVMERWRSTGECLGGAYFTCPDLVVTRRPGVREMFAAVRDMVANGDHETTLRRIG
ncbi:polymorphic toxin-type HINT domain-containing protein [Nocardiopsis composta]|uniref:polymorphic toxin-type HINT domain-containing protein n=1 Tax=Nocardiopsis composta TaxID=157465 RepID=UPI001C864F6D|nr:polymorphic toxin-type HINT domain-containing protein [Nocardiopsis composta]